MTEFELPRVPRFGDEWLGGPTAAAELGLGRGEFARAVDLGIVRADGPTDGLDPGPSRFSRGEIARVRMMEGSTETLRERVAMVGPREAATLLSVAPGRFTRLARCGRFTPVDFRVNRYRSVVWSYLVEDLRKVSENAPELVRARTTPADLLLLAARVDLRPRRWRTRRVGLLSARARSGWERAAAIASFLPEEALLATVPDPEERIILAALAPAPPFGHPRTGAAAAVAAAMLSATGEEETLSYRAMLSLVLSRLREPLPEPEAPRSESAGTPGAGVAGAERALPAVPRPRTRHVVEAVRRPPGRGAPLDPGRTA
ncbi:DUF6397 family protein [Streptomyces sp. BI20]|uniref:DUF6397 family protein n=1 Tax=Streptomyces sp. BI20 TaxID=3403460 RepID=UPI003C720270